MKGIIFLFVAIFGISATCSAQKAKVYNWSWKTDGIILAGSIAGYTGSQALINNAQKATFADLGKLDKSKVWGFDRGAIGNNSYSAAHMSDMFLMGSLALPLLSQFDKGAHSERVAIIGMMFETLLINHNISSTLKATTQRYRPYTYNSSLSEEGRITSTSRQSFVSGHTSTVAAASFFTAKVLTDLNPDSKLKPLIWASAIAIPAATGYLRYKAGKHFPSDVIAGYGIGALVGFFVPHFHKIKIKSQDVKLDLGSVTGGGLGLSMTVNLN